MPMFRIQLDDGQEHTLQAARAVTDGSDLRFENRTEAGWQPVRSVPISQVQHFARRVNETHGWRWVRARLESLPSTAAHYARP